MVIMLNYELAELPWSHLVGEYIKVNQGSLNATSQTLY